MLASLPISNKPVTVGVMIPLTFSAKESALNNSSLESSKRARSPFLISIVVLNLRISLSSKSFKVASGNGCFEKSNLPNSESRLLNSYGNMGTFSGSPLAFKRLFKTLPPDVATMLWLLGISKTITGKLS